MKKYIISTQNHEILIQYTVRMNVPMSILFFLLISQLYNNTTSTSCRETQKTKYVRAPIIKEGVAED